MSKFFMLENLEISSLLFYFIFKGNFILLYEHDNIRSNVYKVSLFAVVVFSWYGLKVTKFQPPPLKRKKQNLFIVASEQQ